MNEIIGIEITPPAVSDKIKSLIEAFLSGRNSLTIKAYRQDLESFSKFLKSHSAKDSVHSLLSLLPGDANALTLSYRSRMIEERLSPATINRRLASLRALVKLARTLGLITWKIEIQNIKSQSYRDLRGPEISKLKNVILELVQRNSPKTKRDLAIIRLLHDLGLRRGEVTSLDLAHIDLNLGTISILGKGKTERTNLTLPEETQWALRNWIEIRGNEPGALFINFDRAKKGKRLTGSGLYALSKYYGLGRPHGIRHLAITEALDKTGGDVRSVQRFSRHKNLAILNIYDDNRQDLGGSVAKIVAAGL